MSDENQLPLNPWHPMTKPIDLKHLGKLAEECGELSAAIARCIIQGINESEPTTGKLNKDWLRDELADVMANIELVMRHFSIDYIAVIKRMDKKEEHLKAWHSMLATEE